MVSVHSHHRCNMRRQPTRSFQWWLMGFGPVNFRLINLWLPVDMYFFWNWFKVVWNFQKPPLFCSTGWSALVFGISFFLCVPHFNLSPWQITVTMSTHLKKYADSIKFRQAGPALAGFGAKPSWYLRDSTRPKPNIAPENWCLED